MSLLPTLLLGCLLLPAATFDFGDGTNNGDTSASCPDGSVDYEGTCTECTEGQYTFDNTTCGSCPLGSYSSEGSTNCTNCTGTLSTLTEESTNVTDCVEVCSIPSMSNVLSVSPLSGTNVLKGSSVTVICSTGYQYNNTHYYIQDCATTLPDCITITTSTASSYHLSSSTLTLTCTVYGTAPTSGTWYKDGVLWQSGASFTQSTSEFVSTVEITTPAYTDGGGYHCTALIDNVTETAAAVDVQVLSIETFNTASLSVTSGTTTALSCTIHSPSALSLIYVQWYKSNTEVTDGTSTSVDTVNHLKTGTLTIQDLSLSDSGNYSCYAVYTGYGTITSDERVLTVVGVKTSPVSRKVRKDYSMYLECQTEGPSDVTTGSIKWSINSTEATSYNWTQLADTTVTDPSAEYTVTYSLDSDRWPNVLTTKFYINNAIIADTGTYQCSVEYDANTATASADLTVLDLGILTSPDDASVEAGMDITLTCTFDDLDEYTITDLKWFSGDASYGGDTTASSVNTTTGTIATEFTNLTDASMSAYTITITNAAVTETGLYLCQVTHQDTTSTDFAMNSTAAKVYVLGIYNPPVSVIGGQGQTITLTCTLAGELTSVTWTATVEGLSTEYNTSTGVTVEDTDSTTLTTVTTLEYTVPKEAVEYSVTASSANYTVTSDVANVTVYHISIIPAYTLSGNTVTLTAIVDAPDTTYSTTWFDMDSSNETTAIFNGTVSILTLTISNVTYSSKLYSAAAYWVYGDNEVEVIADPVSITILEFTTSPANFSAVYNSTDSTTLTCTVTDNTLQYNVSWYFGDTLLENYTQDEVSTLALTDLQFNDTGYYYCTAQFEGMEGVLESDRALVTVSGISFSMVSRYISTGSLVPCIGYVSDGGGTVEWVKDDGTVYNSVNSTDTTITSTLNITGSVTINDIYTCEVTDTGLNMTFTSVSYGTYVLETDAYTPTTGDNVTLTCSSNTNLTMDYTVGWFDSADNAVNESATIELTATPGSGSGYKSQNLTLVNPDTDYTFTCIISTTAGDEFTSEAIVDYIYVSVPSNATITGSSVDLSCVVSNATQEPDGIIWSLTGTVSESSYISESKTSTLTLAEPTEDVNVNCTVYYGDVPTVVQTTVDVIEVYTTKSANEDESTLVSCVVEETQSPPHTMQWYKAGVLVNDTSDITISNMTMSNSSYTITLNSTLVSDQQYQCVIGYGHVTLTKMASIDNIKTAIVGEPINFGEPVVVTCSVYGAQGEQPDITWSNGTQNMTAGGSATIKESTFGTWTSSDYQNSTLTVTNVKNDTTFTCSVTHRGQGFTQQYEVKVTGIIPPGDPKLSPNYP